MAYITYIGKHVNEIVCKRCRTVIAARRGVAQNLRVDLNDAYTILVLEMRNPDGQLSKHETPMCRDCADVLRAGQTSREELERLYTEDMDQHYATTVLAGYPPQEVQNMVARFSSRIPLRALDEPARGRVF